MPNRIVEIAASGGDYTSFSAALAGESDFQAGDDNIIFRRTDNVRDTSGFTVSGFTTSSSHWVILECNSDVQHDGTRLSGAGIVGAVGWSEMISVSIQYVKFYRLELRNSGTWGTTIGTHANNNVIDSCLIYDCQTGISAQGETYLINSIIYNCAEFGINGVPKYAYNNTILNCTTTGLSSAAWGATSSKNNYVGGSGTADYADAHDTTTYTTCASSDASDSTTEIEVSACVFTSSTAGSEDANIGSGSDLIAAGTDLSADAVYAVSVDCFGTERAATPCIGAIEYAATVTGNSYYYQQQQM
jgi:hypothetical protein